jgi:cysteine desulfurase / selenocysteine lyase
VSQRRVYLDHAATTWPKPPGVVEACTHYQTDIGVAASRGAYRTGEVADRVVASTRQLLLKAIGATDSDGIAFMANGTLALHAGLVGLLSEWDLASVHVVTTATDHNSVLRPLARLEDSRNLQWTAVPCDGTGAVSMDDFRRAMRPQTRLVIVNHASNVTGAVQDISRVAEIAHEAGAWVMVDAAQSLGYVELDVERMGLDLLAAPGHKGLGGMLGSGFLYASSRVREQVESPWIGGTGRSSERLRAPFGWQESMESGNLNLPAIASLQAGLSWLLEHRETSTTHALQHWTAELVDEIARHPKLRYHGPRSGGNDRVPVISLSSPQFDCHEMAMLLDSELGIEARSGFHCAALIHSHLGTERGGGTLRLSLGHMSTAGDVESAMEGIRMLASAMA